MAKSTDIVSQVPQRVDGYTDDVRRFLNSNFENLQDLTAPLDEGQGVNGSFDVAGTVFTITNGIITGIV